jgi:hypothetical protein
MLCALRLAHTELWELQLVAPITHSAVLCMRAVHWGVVSGACVQYRIYIEYSIVLR